MQKDPEQKLEQFVREKGKELEAAMRDAGTPLPAGLTGETFVRGALADMEQMARTPEAQAMSARIGKIFKRVAAELPGGVQDPAFEERMRAAMNEEFGKDEDGTGASA